MVIGLHPDLRLKDLPDFRTDRTDDSGIMTTDERMGQGNGFGERADTGGDSGICYASRDRAAG